MTSIALTPLERKNIRRAISQTKSECAVLVGSVARGTRNRPEGDLDILILDGSHSHVLMPGVQVTVLSSGDLADRVASGDDFVQWALRFGVAIRGRTKWTVLRSQLLESAPWPKTQAKQEHASRRMARARELLDMGDAQAAQEELMYAASHLARARLLEERVFPLSRPELPSQLKEHEQEELAALLERLYSNPEPDLDQLRVTFDHLQGWLHGTTATAY